MKDDCLFCNLSRDTDTVIWHNDDFAAFKDIHPKARVHVLVVPKRHVASLDHANAKTAAGLIEAIQAITQQQGVSGKYRLEFNVGRTAGQEIDHLHAHILAA